MPHPPPSEAELSAGDLWSQIMAMPRPHRIVAFPRRGEDGNPLGELAIVVLSQEEGMAAKASTVRHVRKVLGEAKGAGVVHPGESAQGYADLCEMRDSLELLFRACKRPGELSKPFFSTIDDIGRKLTTDEIAVLVHSYRRVQAELGPIVAELSTEEVDAWIERLAKGASLDPFDFLSLGAASALMHTLAARLWSYMTASSSPGLPPDAPT